MNPEKLINFFILKHGTDLVLLLKEGTDKGFGNILREEIRNQEPFPSDWSFLLPEEATLEEIKMFAMLNPSLYNSISDEAVDICQRDGLARCKKGVWR